MIAALATFIVQAILLTFLAAFVLGAIALLRTGPTTRGGLAMWDREDA